MTETISCESFLYALSKDNKPVLTVTSGAQVIFETFDCFQNQIQSNKASFDSMDWNKINPATG